MELQVHNGAAVALNDDVFGAEFKKSLIHQVVVAYQNAGRAGTVGQKNRAAVSGGGKKPWRQKGTGRARAGTIRSPIWVGGGVTFAATNRDYSQKVNRKMYRGALRSILSELARSERLVLVDGFDLDAPSTKTAISKLADLGVERCLIVTTEVSGALALSVRNVPYVDVTDIEAMSPVALVGAKKVVMTTDAAKKIEEWLA